MNNNDNIIEITVHVGDISVTKVELDHQSRSGSGSGSGSTGLTGLKPSYKSVLTNGSHNGKSYKSSIVHEGNSVQLENGKYKIITM